MASALYASRNGPHWGERNVYMRKNPSAVAVPTLAAAATTTSSSNPNPRQHADPTALPSAATPQLSPRYRRSPSHNGAGTEDSSSFTHKAPPFPNHHGDRRDSVSGGYVTFNVATYSRTELRDLRRRLVSELERVRGLASWIESRDLYPATRSGGGSASDSYGGGGGNREVTSFAAAKPPTHRTFPPSDPSPGPRSEGNRPNSNPKADQSSRQQQRMPSPLPLVDNHKKLSGSKRPPPPVAFPRDPKRPVAAAGAVADSISDSLMKKCGLILTKLMKHKHGWVFNVPVDVVGMGLHDYNLIVKRPMDLGTVKSKLNRNLYGTPLEFAADVRLTFNNAILYNPKGHDVYIMAEQLLRLFEDLFAPANEKYQKQQRAIAREKKQKNLFPPAETLANAPPPRCLPPPPSAVAAPVKQDVASSTPRPVQLPQQQASLPPPQQAIPLAPPQTMIKPVAGKQPKPKAKDPHKREMSFKEKHKLSQDLQSLPDEKMSQVLQIVKRRNPDPAQDGDEIELDFEALDVETLWELDRFVNNCKKMMSKMRKKEANSAAAPPLPPSASPVTARTEEKVAVATVGETTPDAAAAGKKTLRRPGGETGEEDVDIGDDMPSTNFPPVEIEKDNGYESSSSSDSSSDSDSSSSSSDSDSRSSSDSDSDADGAQSVQSPTVGLRPPQQPPPRN